MKNTVKAQLSFPLKRRNLGMSRLTALRLWKRPVDVIVKKTQSLFTNSLTGHTTSPPFSEQRKWK